MLQFAYDGQTGPVTDGELFPTACVVKQYACLSAIPFGCVIHIIQSKISLSWMVDATSTGISSITRCPDEVVFLTKLQPG